MSARQVREAEVYLPIAALIRETFVTAFEERIYPARPSELDKAEARLLRTSSLECIEIIAGQQIAAAWASTQDGGWRSPF